MKRIVLWFLFALAAGASDRPAPPPADVKSLLREIVAARADLYRLGVEFLEWKVRDFAGAYERAVAEQARLEREERALVDELTTPEGDTGEAGARRRDISNTELPRLRESRSLNGQRIAELSARLAKERGRQVLIQQLADQTTARLREIDTAEQKETGK